MPDLRRIDTVPARDLARFKQIVDRGRHRATARGVAVAKGLAEISAFGMRLQVEQADDIVCVHCASLAVKGFGAPRATTARNPAATPRASDRASCFRPSNTAPAASATSQACFPFRSIPCAANQGIAFW